MLNGSAKTSNKILNNMVLFKYRYIDVNQSSNNKRIYKFDWKFADQSGYIIIKYRDRKISNGLLISTYESSKHPFDRLLGLYTFEFV